MVSEEIKATTAMALRMRKNLIEMAYHSGAKSAHIGGGLSIIDITATLFGRVMKVNREDPQDPGRDRFILSKGHGVLGYYTALHEMGWISKGTFTVRAPWLIFIRTPRHESPVWYRILKW